MTNIKQVPPENRWSLYGALDPPLNKVLWNNRIIKGFPNYIPNSLWLLAWRVADRFSLLSVKTRAARQSIHQCTFIGWFPGLNKHSLSSSLGTNQKRTCRRFILGELTGGLRFVFSALMVLIPRKLISAFPCAPQTVNSAGIKNAEGIVTRGTV